MLRLAASLLLLGSSAVSAQDARHPVVPGHGPIIPAPDADNQPDPPLRYRTVFDIARASGDAKQPNPGLVKVARYLNLLGTRGIRPANGDVVAIVHGSATPLILNDPAYRARFGAANPNLPLIAALKTAGAQVHVCSQAMHGHDIAADALAADVTIDLSAITTLATLQQRGFVLIPD